MILEFLGVRGSIPTTGINKVRTGGNTSCVTICIDDKLLVFDAGTGIRNIIKKYPNVKKTYLSVTHPHWDHIQGLPFFDFLYDSSKYNFFVEYPDSVAIECAKSQMDGVFFPVKFGDLKSKVNHVNYNDLHKIFSKKINVSFIPVKHGGFCHGFKIETQNCKVIYIPDNELSAYNQSEMKDLIDFCKGADYLIHDSQYNDHELLSKYGWGHSSWRECCDLAIRSFCKNVILFHHDPSRNDEEVDDFEKLTRLYLAEQGSEIVAFAAREDQKIILD